jgi:hypothetical protein
MWQTAVGGLLSGSGFAGSRLSRARLSRPSLLWGRLALEAMLFALYSGKDAKDFTSTFRAGSPDSRGTASIQRILGVLDLHLNLITKAICLDHCVNTGIFK